MKRWSLPCSPLLAPLTVLLLGLAACHASPDEPLDEPRDASEAADLLAPGEPPADAATLASLLRARHVEDLPSADDLADYPSAEASLRYLALAGDTMLVRTRALGLLRHFDSPASGELLVALLGDGELHPALRAAALTGLAGQPLDDQPERIELAAAALHDRDPRVALAAVELLDRFAAGRRALRSALRGELPEQVRAAIEAR